MRILVYGLIVLLVGAGVYWADRRQPAEENADVPTLSQSTTPASAPIATVETAPEPPEPPTYSIPWLRAQTIGQVPLTTARVVSDGADFRAAVVSYVSDGLKLNALMLTPKSARPDAGYPVAIVNHGYIPPDEYSTVNDYRGITDYYARQGFLVLKPDYRAHADSEGDREDNLNRMAYALDVLHLVHAVDGLAEADPSRIYMYGHSMGGDVTLRVLQATDRVRAASLWAPVSEDFPEGFLYFVRRNRPEQAADILRQLAEELTEDDYAAFSPRAHLEHLNTPLLIHHGTDDESVPYDWSVALAAALEDAGKTFTFHTYPGEDHNLRNGSWGTVAGRDVSFFAGT
jgi:dipeptidyl aminopeptidase/acylaminoacyl peptidase